MRARRPIRQAVRLPRRASHFATVRTLTPSASAACRCVQPCVGTRTDEQSTLIHVGLRVTMRLSFGRPSRNTGLVW